MSPAELEALLAENEHVADVAVVGVETYVFPSSADREHWGLFRLSISIVNNTSARGEAPRAYIAIHPRSKGLISENQITDWVAERVARHKRLAGGVIIVDQIPRLASGKIERKILKNWAKSDSSPTPRSNL